jgi:hypothetical protein
MEYTVETSNWTTELLFKSLRSFGIDISAVVVISYMDMQES